ncbi:MFS transporter [Methylobacterium sp. J-030]|uniref:MFS transporter n=1 Tax=Methylobacterium sp. J-030 TaxID=2836627 RepID=UPI001FB96EFC|nr:MFS transporter [Methylobacterium sp. J-030]MCJ2072471.1 MFS transporter [Methylobacterium sp. J-030]
MFVLPAATTANASERLYTKITWRLLPFLTTCYMFAFLDRINIGFAKLQMQSDLGFSDAVYGTGAGIFFIGYVIFEIPSNLLLARIGARKTVARILILWGIVSAGMMFTHDTTTFYALRFLLGVFEAGFAPGMILYLTYWYAPARMARVMAVVMAAGPIGGALGGPMSGWAVAALDGVHGLRGWQWMFLIEGLPCVVLGVIAYLTLTDRPEQARWLDDGEKALLAGDLAVHPGRVEGHSPLLKAVLDPRVLGIAASNFCVICGIYTVSFWLPTILSAAGLTSTTTIGLVSALPYVAALAAMRLLCLSSDRRRERRWHSALCGLVGAAALLLATTYPQTLAVALPGITLATAMMWASYTVLWAIPADYLDPAAAPGGIAFVNVVGVLGGFFSPVIIGSVKTATGSISAGLLVMVGLLVAGAVVMLANRLPRPA